MTRLASRWSWLEHAACAGDTRAFWVAHPSHISPADLEQARAVCRTCPVLTQCDAWASADPALEGVAAGLLRPPPKSEDTTGTSQHG